jgi:hypothetical protein
MLPLAISAQNIRTINVKQGDDIDALLGSDKYTIDSLIVTGYIEHKDFPVLNDCCLNGKLSGIDMSNCTVEDDSIPKDAFHQYIKTHLYTVQLKYFTFPKTVKKIGLQAFAYTRIHKIDLPETVNYIEEWAFHENWAVTGEVKIPEGVTELGNATFRNCYHINKLILPSTLKKIDIQTLWGIDDLTEITLPDGIEELGMGAIGCTPIKEITIPKSIKKLGDYTFGLCQHLSKVSLPDNLKYIPAYMFYDDADITSIELPASLERIGQSAFESTKLPSLVIPDNVRTIDRGAFYSVQPLVTVVLPEKLDSLGLSAFDRCRNLHNVYAKNPVPPFTSTTLGGDYSESPFNGIPADARLYVPVGAKATLPEGLILERLQGYPRGKRVPDNCRGSNEDE